MTAQTCNGCSNYETWNVNLWIDNDEPLYRAKQEWLRGHVILTGMHVKDFVLGVLPNGTSDFDDVRDYERVDWGQIAESWQTEIDEDQQVFRAVLNRTVQPSGE